MTNPDSEPLYSESIERSRRFLENYVLWLDGQESKIQRESILNAFLIYPNVVQGVEVMRMQSQYGNGLVFEGMDGILRDEWYFLLDVLAKGLHDFGYIKMISDRRHFDRGDYVEAIERYYFKPKIAYDESNRREQRYGNVLMTLSTVNDEPKLLKVQGSLYHGYNYLKPEPFEELIENLLTP